METRNDFFSSIPFKDAVIGWGIIVIPLVTLFALAMIFLRPQPIDRAAVLGCYVAQGAPALDVTMDAIRIDAPPWQKFTYTVEPFKEGYQFTVEPALNLHPTDNGKYSWFLEKGIGYFWTLLPKNSNDSRMMDSPKDYGGRFQVIASDGASVIFKRTLNVEACH